MFIINYVLMFEIYIYNIDINIILYTFYIYFMYISIFYIYLSQKLQLGEKKIKYETKEKDVKQKKEK